MSKVSLIYRNVWLYRLMMNVLYTSGYKQRFEQVERVIENYKPKSVLELCFGDIFIAEYCKSKNISWVGIDSNTNFVSYAKRKGFDGRCIDLLSLSKLPKADVCIIIGSLYHFHNDVNLFLSRMLEMSDTLIISEPIKNLSDQKGLIGWIAKKSANAGKGDEHFRYNQVTLIEMLNKEAQQLNFNFKVISFYKKDIIIVIEKNGNN